MYRSVLVVGFAAALVVAAPKSYAQTIIDVDSAGINTAASLSGIAVAYTGVPALTIPDVYAGVINLHVSNTSLFDPGQTLGVFCTDIFTDLVLSGGFFVATSNLENGLGDSLSASTEAQIGWLINNYNMLGTEADGVTPVDLSVSASVDEYAAATQVAIWQTEYGSDFTFTDASDTNLAGFVTDLADATASLGSSFAGNIDEWEPSLADGTPDPSLNQGQSFIGANGLTNDEPPPVPEPASLALLASAMFGLAAVRRRKRG